MKLPMSRWVSAFGGIGAYSLDIATCLHGLLGSEPHATVPVAWNIITSHTCKAQSHFVGAAFGYTQVSPPPGASVPANSPTTPIARSKTAALARILDCVPRGYHRYTFGTVKVAKAKNLARKFHALYGIGCTPAQRLTRKQKQLASVLLVMYVPAEAGDVHWLLLATDGDGLETEHLCSVKEKPRLRWLGYELGRQLKQTGITWTWRRPREDMADLYALIASQANLKHYAALGETLERIARQPGFHGVRTQSWSLLQEARRRGFEGELPYLFFVQKVSHGDRLELSESKDG